MEKKICSITGVRYEGFGNNAEPFDGRCSDEANERYVIPARMLGITRDDIAKYGKARVMEAIDAYSKQFEV